MTGRTRAVVVTVSDRVASGLSDDESGPALASELVRHGYDVAPVRVVPDGVESVEAALRQAIREGAELVLTTGGTGFAPRDLTPEGTHRVLDRDAPGLGEAMRAAGRATTAFADLSRGTAGLAGSTVVVNLPGSLRGATESLAAIVPILRHAIEQARGGDHGHGRGGADPAANGP